MKADHLSYRKATGVSLLGLAIQLVMGLVMLVYAVISPDPAAFSASLFILCGAVVWLCLAIVFDQHRRERLEALEAENLVRSGVAGSSVFEGAGDDMKVAARRLAWIHRVMLPTVSLVLAAVMITLGWWRFRHALRDLQILTIETLPSRMGMQLSLGIAFALIGFVFARFVSGMGKQKVWQLLRAGAAQTVGAALLGFAMVVAQFIDFAGPDLGVRYIHLIFPAMMMLIGAEFVLNFILTVYRPRKTGEIPLPPFDSRILGFVAAPDRIAESIGEALNYQFGIDVTGSWFYQLLSRSLPLLLTIGGAVIWAMTCFSVVRTNEQGLRLRTGKLVEANLPPGLYFKLPWPFERIETYDTTSPHHLDLAGYPAMEKNKAYLWTSKHHAEERNFLVRPSSSPAPAASDSADGGAQQPLDYMLLSVEVPVVFEISDLRKYYELAQDGMGDHVLEAAGRRVVMRYLVTQRGDDVLADRRTDISRELQAAVEREFNRLDAGVKVLFVGIVGVHPPTRTAQSFEAVVGADQSKIAAVEKAREEEGSILTEAVGELRLAKDIIHELDVLDQLKRSGDEAAVTAQAVKVEALLTAAGGQAGVTLAKAKTDRWVKLMAAKSRAARYEAQLQAFKAGGDVYMAQLYFDTMGDVLSKARVFLTPDSSVPVEVRMDLIEETDNGSALRKLTKDEP